ITYAVNKEFKLKSFLDSPYGLMSSTKVEEKFRELDILRNSMMASDICNGAENLALFFHCIKQFKCMVLNLKKTQKVQLEVTNLTQFLRRF
ncbi:MAG: hypothetical protein U0L03_01540, partial [Succinivibrionaceae bacterium]|nr:hypothetical protein [Succinivibrionaceae bacterium]